MVISRPLRTLIRLWLRGSPHGVRVQTNRDGVVVGDLVSVAYRRFTCGR